MRLRTIYGSLMVAGVILLVVAESNLPTRRILGAALMTLLAIGGWIEFARLTGISGSGHKAHAGLHVLGFITIIYFFALAWLAGSQVALPGGPGAWLIGGLVGQVLIAFLLVVSRQNFEPTYVSLLEAIVGCLLIGFCLSFLVRIYCERPQGPVLWLAIIGGVKGNDIAAYYVGKTWGTHHFSKVSPKKTLEGSAGALLFSVLYFTGAGALLSHHSYGSPFSVSGGILIGMVISIASQAGDLSESLFKRVYQVKDSGALLPEFGGVLDMIDSLLFSGAISWLALGGLLQA